MLIVWIELTLFLVMNGADFGAGIAAYFVKDLEEREEILRVPSAVWYGNETWYVVGMGTMFGAFPHWYAGVASGYYLVFILTLACFILRGLGFDVRRKWRLESMNTLWEVALFVGSLVPPFLMGIIFSSTLAGVPIVEGVVRAGFFDIVTPFTVVSGITLVLLSLAIGLGRVIKFIEPTTPLHKFLRKRLSLILLLLMAALVVESTLLPLYTDVFVRRPGSTIFFGLCLLASVVGAMFLVRKCRDHLNFWLLSAAVGSFVLLVFSGLFPNAIMGSAGTESLTLVAAASGESTQKWAMAGSAAMLPLLVIGQGIAYYIVNRDYRIPDTDING
jgi:cytochrome bd-type quinol oxidase subunit 2